MGQLRHIITEGIILKTSQSREIDRFFYFISPDLGVTNAIAYGASKIKSRFCSKVQPFVSAKLFLYKSRKFNSLKLDDIASVETNEFIKTDIKSIYLASFFSEILLNSLLSNEEYKTYYYLLRYSYELLKNKNDIKKAFIFFTCKLFYLHGYNFRLNSCRKCNRKFNNYYFDFFNGGILCENHIDLKNKQFPISETASELLTAFINKKYLELRDIDINNKEFNMIFPIAVNSIKKIYEKDLKTISNLFKILSF